MSKESKSPLQVGRKVLCMTPTTHYWVGEVIEITPFEIVLKNASWIPDLGRHHEAVAKGSFTEIECHGDCITALPRPGTVIIEYKNDLPKESK